MKLKYIIFRFVLILFSLFPIFVSGQQEGNTTENIHARGMVVDRDEIRLRWSPANTGAWSEGIKYGYTLKRYTVMVDKRWQENPDEITLCGDLKPQPLAGWEDYANKSDYAAVIAQAFYGEDFELSASGNNDIGSIINQANELEQRFSTSVFMAEYDYKAAELAGWAWTDNTAKENERYLYRIYLNRPQRQAGDTAAVYIGVEDKKELPQPIGLNALAGDKGMMLSWNYSLLSDTYHSYHIERKSGGEPFRQITELPVTALNDQMQAAYYMDSLPDNQTLYTYRITGLTGFGQTGPYSQEVSGKGEKALNCIPYIYSGDFIDKDRAKIYWEFQCEDPGAVSKFSLLGAADIDGQYRPLTDNIRPDKTELEFTLPKARAYVKLQAETRDGTTTESFPFLLRQTDSIPPAVPEGLKVEIDTAGVAHLSWDANREPDLRGYRILRAFTENGEKSSITPGFIPENKYADTLSLNLGNPYVYYSLTAIDQRYNESEPCQAVKAAKPNRKTPDEPVIIGYESVGNNVTVQWVVNPQQGDITYRLVRTCSGKPACSGTVFEGDHTTDRFTDQVPGPGRYTYSLVATDPKGKKSFSPKPLEVEITAGAIPEAITGFSSYGDAAKGYIELSWRRHQEAKLYRIYKATEKEKMTLWKEVPQTQTRITDEMVYPGNKYTYTILYITNQGRPSKASTITVEY
jgi:fibronectin type 3 domain-containing protein